jgi:hypothetical protein
MRTLCLDCQDLDWLKQKIKDDFDTPATNPLDFAYQQEAVDRAKRFGFLEMADEMDNDMLFTVKNVEGNY